MNKNGKRIRVSTKAHSKKVIAPRKRAPAATRKRSILGRYIIADPAICHGKPTFRGTRIMVWQVLEMLSEGMAWESIIDEFGGRITKDAVAEAVTLASRSFVKHAHEHAFEPTPA